MQAQYISREAWGVLLPHMTEENALAIVVSLETGLRVGDVLRIRVSHLFDSGFHYVSCKTGKSGTAKCSSEVLAMLRENARDGICFPGRKGSKSPFRSRQAVWRDVRKAANRVGLAVHVSPHSARKTFAVDLYHKKGISAVQKALQHGSVHTTNLYALADLQGVEYNRKAIEDAVFKRVLERLGVI